MHPNHQQHSNDDLSGQDQLTGFGQKCWNQGCTVHLLVFPHCETHATSNSGCWGCSKPSCCQPLSVYLLSNGKEVHRCHTRQSTLQNLWQFPKLFDLMLWVLFQEATVLSTSWWNHEHSTVLPQDDLLNLLPLLPNIVLVLCCHACVDCNKPCNDHKNGHQLVFSELQKCCTHMNLLGYPQGYTVTWMNLVAISM